MPAQLVDLVVVPSDSCQQPVGRPGPCVLDLDGVGLCRRVGAGGAPHGGHESERPCQREGGGSLHVHVVARWSSQEPRIVAILLATVPSVRQFLNGEGRVPLSEGTTVCRLNTWRSNGWTTSESSSMTLRRRLISFASSALSSKGGAQSKVSGPGVLLDWAISASKLP